MRRRRDMGLSPKERRVRSGQQHLEKKAVAGGRGAEQRSSDDVRPRVEHLQPKNRANNTRRNRRRNWKREAETVLGEARSGREGS